jgi:hypothetical protein
MGKDKKTPITVNDVVLRLTDGCSIPFDEKNTDYLDYLAWLEQGNTPEPANS